MSSSKPGAFIPYSDSLETPFPDEARVSAEILTVMGRTLQGQYTVHKKGLRDAHAKSHGALKGTLTVYDKLPEHLKQGLFATPQSYPVVIRLSTSPGTIQSDEVNALRAFAIKIIGVEGPQLLSAHKNEKTQDLLLVNSTILPFADLAAYLKAVKMGERKINGSVAEKLKTVKIAGRIHSILKFFGQEKVLLKALTSPHTHILGETMHTAGVLRFGNYFGRISVAPLSSNVKALAGLIVDPSGKPELIREQVTGFFAKQSAEYELRIQLCTDLDRMPVENPSVEWPEALSPHLPIGKIVLPMQDTGSESRRRFVDDVLSFNPWHGIEAHRPLGNLMRVRRLAYEQSSKMRHKLNKLERFEPRSISDIPD